MSRPPNFLQMCSCGHYGSVHDASPGFPHGVVEGHGPCLVEGCSCTKFTWVSSDGYPSDDLSPTTVEAIGPDDDRSWCNRCGGRDPDCYICGPRRGEPL